MTVAIDDVEPLEEQLARVGTCEVAVAFLTYNNADTLPAVLAIATRALAAGDDHSRSLLREQLISEEFCPQS